MRRIDAINVIPFIDIMLVLLAIVLTTATFIVEGQLEIRLPAASGEAPAPQAEPLELALDRDGHAYLGTAPISLDALGARLDRIAPETPVVLRVDADARFGQFVAVVDLLKVRDLNQLSILTRRQ